MTDETYIRELREKILDALQVRPALRSKSVIPFKCPVHGGSSANAWIRDYAWGCFVCGDAVDPKLVTLARLIGVPVSSEGYAHRGFTVEDYADQKGFSVQDLLRWGIKTVETDREVPVVAWECKRPDGTTVRTQVRNKRGKKWWLDDGEGVFPYGLEVMAQEANLRKPVILVEGESDTLAMRSMGYLAVGIPGADTWKPEWAEFFKDRERVYLWKEPGQGGATFEARVGKSLPRVRILHGEKLGEKDPADLRQKLGEPKAKEILDIALKNAAPIGIRPLEISYTAVGGAAMAALGERLRAPIEAIPTPFPSWNDVCGMLGGRVGLARGWYALIMGGSGMGKTYTASAVANHAALAGHRVCFHSFEMGWDELALRNLAQLSGMPIRDLEPGVYHNPEKFKEAHRIMEEKLGLTGGEILLNDRPLHKLDQLLDSIRYHYEVNGCILHIVDYLQLAWVGSAESMQRQIVEVSHGIRALTKELRITTIGLSQFNRETSSQRDIRPTKEGALGGSALENDSDQSILLDHSRIIRNQWGWATWLIIDKNRHGKQIDVPVQFNTDTLTMRERQADEIGANQEMKEPQQQRRK